MFNKPGRKLKLIANILLYSQWGTAFIIGFAHLILAIVVENELYFLITALCWTIAPLISWVINLFIYGVGQLIDNTDKLVLNQGKCTPPETPKATSVVTPTQKYYQPTASNQDQYFVKRDEFDFDDSYVEYSSERKERPIFVPRNQPEQKLDENVGDSVKPEGDK